LYPHAGGFNPVKIDDLAKNYNAYPLYGTQALAMPIVDNERVQVTAFKPAYDGNGFILRMFERTGAEATAKLVMPIGYKLDCEVDLLEDKMGDVAGELSFKPFQIRSFRIIKA
jgi:alpha-mannosidase